MSRNCFFLNFCVFCIHFVEHVSKKNFKNGYGGRVGGGWPIRVFIDFFIFLLDKTPNVLSLFLSLTQSHSHAIGPIA